MVPLALAGAAELYRRTLESERESRRIDATWQNLRFLAAIPSEYAKHASQPPRFGDADATPEEQGLRALVLGLPVEYGWLNHTYHPYEWVEGKRPFIKPQGSGGFAVVDAWGRPYRYRCPGPVHKHGWDIYSLGPDGMDDQGEGDDLIIGGDFAAIESATR